MKIFVLIFLITVNFLYANSKIILLTLSSEKNANNALALYKDTPSYGKLSNLKKYDDFTVHVRESGNYYVVVAEVFKNKEIALQALQIIKEELNQVNIQEVFPKQNTAVKKTSIVTNYNEVNVSVKEDTNTTTQYIQNEKAKEVVKKPLLNEPKNVISTKDFFVYLAIFGLMAAIIFYFSRYKNVYDLY